MTAEEEVEALRALLRKVQRSVGWWAALSYPDGAHGQPSRWSPAERLLLTKTFGSSKVKL